MPEQFTYMRFYGGANDIEFVVHAEKYTEAEALDLFFSAIAGDCDFEDFEPPPKEGDIECRHVRGRYVRYYDADDVPDTVDPSFFDDGCYTYCSKSEPGSFPVWVIEA